MEMSGQLHIPSQFTPMEVALGTHWVGGLVGIRASLNALENRRISAPAEIQTLSPQSFSM
jgi:hypothetical protein